MSAAMVVAIGLQRRKFRRPRVISNEVVLTARSLRHHRGESFLAMHRCTPSFASAQCFDELNLHGTPTVRSDTASLTFRFEEVFEVKLRVRRLEAIF